METVIDAKARSGRTLRFLKTDGDGVFNSGSFEELRVKFGFIHEKSAPYDHDGNTEIEREIRTIFEGVATALESSGASPYFWAEAMHHFVFTKNVLPLVPVQGKDGKTTYTSAQSARPFQSRLFSRLRYFVYVLPTGRKKGRGESARTETVFQRGRNRICTQHERI